ncbi:hypothetical protein D7X99_22830 [Corallococcus sp. AB032C]|nr:hypothetical protein D7X99_22830 [Corallococcus sp. AB032C]
MRMERMFKGSARKHMRAGLPAPALGGFLFHVERLKRSRVDAFVAQVAPRSTWNTFTARGAKFHVEQGHAVRLEAEYGRR